MFSFLILLLCGGIFNTAKKTNDSQISNVLLKKWKIQTKLCAFEKPKNQRNLHL